MSSYTYMGYKDVCQVCHNKRIMWKCDLTGGVVYACRKCTEDFSRIDSAWRKKLKCTK